FFFFSSRRRHTRFSRDWSSDVCSSDLRELLQNAADANATSVDIKFETIPTDVPDGSTKQDRLKALIKAKSKRIIVKNNGHCKSRSEERRVGKECRCRWEREN